MSVTPNFCCDETKNRAVYTRLTPPSNLELFLGLIVSIIFNPTTQLFGAIYGSLFNDFQIFDVFQISPIF